MAPPSNGPSTKSKGLDFLKPHAHPVACSISTILPLGVDSICPALEIRTWKVRFWKDRFYLFSPFSTGFCFLWIASRGRGILARGVVKCFQTGGALSVYCKSSSRIGTTPSFFNCLMVNLHGLPWTCLEDKFYGFVTYPKEKSVVGECIHCSIHTLNTLLQNITKVLFS